MSGTRVVKNYVSSKLPGKLTWVPNGSPTWNTSAWWLGVVHYDVERKNNGDWVKQSVLIDTGGTRWTGWPKILVDLWQGHKDI